LNNETSDTIEARILAKLETLPDNKNIETQKKVINEILQGQKIFSNFRNLRWPKDIMCPKCHSTNVVRKDPPKDSIDERNYYECLDCKEQGDTSDFDDLTGLPEGQGKAEVSQWLLCWRLVGMFSYSEVAAMLGISMAEVYRMVARGSHLSEVPKDKLINARSGLFSAYDKKQTSYFSKRKEETNKTELEARSESLNPYKPTPTSRK